jgi:hypothetical protein
MECLRSASCSRPAALLFGGHGQTPVPGPFAMCEAGACLLLHRVSNPLEATPCTPTTLESEVATLCS